MRQKERILHDLPLERSSCLSRSDWSKNIRIAAGAGFLVALTGEIMTMPGLPKAPAAEGIDVDEEGRITGLF